MGLKPQNENKMCLRKDIARNAGGGLFIGDR